MKVRIQFCSVWNYEPRAVGLAALLLQNLKRNVKSLELEPGTGGCFEVSVDGKLIYSKLETGEFPEDSEILDQLSKRVA